MMFATTKVVIVTTILVCHANFDFAEVNNEVINEIENDDGEIQYVPTLYFVKWFSSLNTIFP